MTEDADALLRMIAQGYLAAGCPERQDYNFEIGKMTDAHRELEAAGLVQRVFGIVGGVGWRLTDAGVERAKQ